MTKELIACILLIILIIVLATVSCISSGGGSSDINVGAAANSVNQGMQSQATLEARATADFGAEQFHIQLTAIANGGK